MSDFNKTDCHACGESIKGKWDSTIQLAIEMGELEGEGGEVKAAQLTQRILNSKTAASEPLEKEIEKPEITTPGEA